MRGVHRVNPAIIAKRLEPYQACEVAQDSLQLEDDENVDAVKMLFDVVAEPRRLSTLLKDHALDALRALADRRARVHIDESATPRTLPGVGAQAAALALEATLREAIGKQRARTTSRSSASRRRADEGVRRAFMSLAKTFHPDKVGRRSPELVELASKVFARISEANDVLSSPEKRSGLHRAAPRRRAARRPIARRSARILTAEQQFQRAEEAVRRKRLGRGARVAALGDRARPDEGEFHSLRGWVHVPAAAGPGRRRSGGRVRGDLKKGIALSPQSPSGCLLPGPDPEGLRRHGRSGENVPQDDRPPTRTTSRRCASSG